MPLEECLGMQLLFDPTTLAWLTQRVRSLEGSRRHLTAPFAIRSVARCDFTSSHSVPSPNATNHTIGRVAAEMRHPLGPGTGGELV